MTVLRRQNCILGVGWQACSEVQEWRRHTVLKSGMASVRRSSSARCPVRGSGEKWTAQPYSIQGLYGPRGAART